MTHVRLEPFAAPSAWTGAQLAQDCSWERRITARERAELEAGLAVVKAKGLTVETTFRGDFPTGAALAGLAAEIVAAVRDGLGFIVVRGFPVEGFSDDDVRLMYWGLGLQMGAGLSQDGTAALVANVRERHTPQAPGTRAYGSMRENPPHVDLTDVVGLLGVRQAKGSPLSTLSSSVTVYNHVLDEHPEWLPKLYEGFYWDRMNEHAAWDEPTTPWKVPLFSYADGQLSVRYNRSWIRNGAERRGGALSEDELAMFDFIDATAKANELKVEMAPGDIYFASNYTVFHGREAYDEAADWDDRVKRLFLRLWLNIAGMRAFSNERVVRHGLIGHGNLGWTNQELLAGRHLQPGFERTYGLPLEPLPA